MRAKAAKRIRPSSSYELLLPQEVAEQHDGGVSSFWVRGESLLLQLSSYIRQEGLQVNARDRLQERIEKTAGNWTLTKRKLINDSFNVDQAIAEFTDENGVLWMHSYFVWPHLAIYATVSGPPRSVRDPDNWAFKALGSVKPIVQ